MEHIVLIIFLTLQTQAVLAQPTQFPMDDGGPVPHSEEFEGLDNKNDGTCPEGLRPAASLGLGPDTNCVPIEEEDLLNPEADCDTGFVKSEDGECFQLTNNGECDDNLVPFSIPLDDPSLKVALVCPKGVTSTGAVESPKSCRSKQIDYAGPDCSAQAISDQDLQDVRTENIRQKKAQCNAIISSASNSCKAVSKGDPSPKKTSGAICEAAKTLSSTAGAAQSKLNECSKSLSACNQTCAANISTMSSILKGDSFDRTVECNSKMSQAVSDLRSLVSELTTSKTQAQKTCDSLNPTKVATPDPDPDPDPDPEPTAPGGDWKDHKPKTVAAKKSGFSIGELAKAALPLALPSLLGGGDGEQPDAPPKQPTPNYTDDFYSEGSNSSSGPISKTRGLNLAKGSGGNDTDGLPDQSLGRDRNEVNAKFNGKTNRSGSPGAGNNSTVANSANGSDSGSGGSGSDARQRRVASAKARNLISGHKSVRANDGGGGLSIRPGAYKKYGRAAMLAKLAAARKKHGKKMPLIFKNGKFVLDFLAMKESKTFKKKHAAMEGYWKGKKPKSPTAKNDVNPNSKLNIFKLMNFRYQKTLYTKGK